MSTNKLKFPIRSLQANIFVLFLITLAAVLTAAYFVRENEKVLRRTLNELSNPDVELALLREILSSLTEAENKLRYFTLTNDTTYFNQYNNLIDTIENNIDLLQMSYTHDSLTSNHLFQVKDLLNQRKDLIISYNQTKQDQAAFDFADIAFSTIRKGTPDSLISRTNTSTTIITTYDTLEAIPDTLESKRKNRGLIGKIKGVFSKSDTPKKETQLPDPIIRSTTSIQFDTSMIKPSDSIKMGHIEQELSQIKAKDQRYYLDLRRKELNMLQNSSLVINQVTEIFNRLEKNVLHENEIRSQQARNNASKSLFLIGVTSIAALLIILILVLLILNNLRRSNHYRKELLKANTQAIELAKVKEEFLSNMSHEIRTPLNAIIGFSNQLLNTKLTPDQTRYLDAVQKSSVHLLETVNDILDLSRLVAGKFHIDKVHFKPGEVLNDVIRPFQLQAKDKGLKFTEVCDYDSNLVLLGDPVRLRQILYNLLSNALKFTREGEIIFICSIKIEGNLANAKMSVKDSGIGIEAHKLESIFEDFQQVETSSARSFGGSGLGLAISRRLARLQGGDIIVESKPEEGSTFCLLISYIVVNDNRDEIITEPDQPSQWSMNEEILKGARVLVVDDDEFNILLSRIITENHGMSIQIAKNGYEAESLIAKESFDLIMTDLQMPGLSGIDLISYIRNHSDPAISRVPVIAFTANKKERFDDELISLGFNEVLQKPVPEDEFLNRISHYVITQPLTEHNHDPIQTMKSSRTESVSLISYDLSHVKAFSAGKPEIQKEILRSFIISSNNAVKSMKNSFSTGDYQEIKNLAHRLLTTYGHLKVESALNLLDQLDSINLSKVEKSRISELINDLTEINKKLYKALKKEMQKL